MRQRSHSRAPAVACSIPTHWTSCTYITYTGTKTHTHNTLKQASSIPSHLRYEVHWGHRPVSRRFYVTLMVDLDTDALGDHDNADRVVCLRKNGNSRGGWLSDESSCHAFKHTRDALYIGYFSWWHLSSSARDICDLH